MMTTEAAFDAQRHVGGKVIKDLLNLTHCILPQAARMRDGAAVEPYWRKPSPLASKTLEPHALSKGDEIGSDAGGHQT